MVLGESTRANSSATIVFGCSTDQTGELTKSDKTVDGIFGFGQQKMSVISQLASHGVAPRAFSHCLRGDGDGGGLLVFGEIVEPNMVYTPLVPLQPYYSLSLESISVNGQMLPIDPSAFATSSNRGTIVDTGTTLTYLVEEAYDPFVNAITTTVTPNVRELVHEETQCYLVSSNINDIFPLVSLNFAGGAAMILSPQDYLVLQNSFDGNALWCIGFQMRRGQEISILGDLILKDKIFVYDLAGQRLGWTSYDCSSSVNVSLMTSTGKSENIYPRHMKNSASREAVACNMTIWCIMLSLLVATITQKNRIYGK
ncbi:hypothetical protein MLD38_009571 [Melastoma candidum]|uniref:Uncharacterized protein n=1 Tax=Melastoma candidum TaxID=119954 RepID=A0ACB9RY61_9MYRT|nr:hypothetical protein MLD38_009571 [Melastoma candidum]